MSNFTKSNLIKTLDKIKRSTRQQVEQGIIQSTQNGERELTLNLLNRSLATEIICIHRYKRHYYVASSLGEQVIANEFLEHANEEQAHADKLADRIAQLGGEPEYELGVIKDTAHTEYKDCDTVEEMLIENLIAEQIAVSIYREIIKFVEEKDPVTRRLLEEILAVEEEHVEDLRDFLNKKKQMIQQRIKKLESKGRALAMKMMKEEKKLGSPVSVSEPEISKIVKELNKLSEEKTYYIGDFIPKK